MDNSAAENDSTANFTVGRNECKSIELHGVPATDASGKYGTKYLILWPSQPRDFTPVERSWSELKITVEKNIHSKKGSFSKKFCCPYSIFRTL